MEFGDEQSMIEIWETTDTAQPRILRNKVMLPNTAYNKPWQR